MQFVTNISIYTTAFHLLKKNIIIMHVFKVSSVGLFDAYTQRSLAQGKLCVANDMGTLNTTNYTKTHGEKLM